jgi:chromosome segregation ATPase
MGSNASSLADSISAESLRHKLIVLEDVVERLHVQKSQLVEELQASEAAVETAKQNVTTVLTQEQEEAAKERRQYQQQIAKMEEARRREHEKSIFAITDKHAAELSDVKAKASETISRQENDKQKLESLLDTLRSKLDSTRKDGQERDAKLRQSLQDEQHARRMLEKANEQAVAQVEEAKTSMADQKETVEESLLISEFAVVAADRREEKLRLSLEEAHTQINALTDELKLSKDGVVSKDESTRQVAELQDRIKSMEAQHNMERQRERLKWGHDVETLQQALEIAKSSQEETANPFQGPDPSEYDDRRTKSASSVLLKRIRRKLSERK